MALKESPTGLTFDDQAGAYVNTHTMQWAEGRLRELAAGIDGAVAEARRPQYADNGDGTITLTESATITDAGDGTLTIGA